MIAERLETCNVGMYKYVCLLLQSTLPVYFELNEKSPMSMSCPNERIFDVNFLQQDLWRHRSDSLPSAQDLSVP